MDIITHWQTTTATYAVWHEVHVLRANGKREYLGGYHHYPTAPAVDAPYVCVANVGGYACPPVRFNKQSEVTAFYVWASLLTAPPF